MISRSRLRGITIVLVVLAVLALVATVALAANGEAENGDDELWVKIGAITLAWSAVQMGLLQILKGIKIGDKLLLNSEPKIWLASGLLSVVGMTIAAFQAGVPLLAAAFQAILAIFAASGEHNFDDMVRQVRELAKNSSPPAA